MNHISNVTSDNLNILLAGIPTFFRRRTNHHSAVVREHGIVSNSVGLIDLTPFAKFHVEGPRAREFLDRVVAGTVPKVGRTSIAHALTHKGKVYAEFTITGLAEDKFMV